MFISVSEKIQHDMIFIYIYTYICFKYSIFETHLCEYNDTLIEGNYHYISF